jgi:hypothetical protein
MDMTGEPTSRIPGRKRLPTHMPVDRRPTREDATEPTLACNLESDPVPNLGAVHSQRAIVVPYQRLRAGSAMSRYIGFVPATVVFAGTQ